MVSSASCPDSVGLTASIRITSPRLAFRTGGGHTKPRRHASRGDRGLRTKDNGGRTVTPAQLATLERRLSPERLAPYRHANGNDLARAVLSTSGTPTCPARSGPSSHTWR